ncbi:Stress response protein SCP2 [Streptomyces zhaozhouensis]|uniref:Stress response protein SCP2 n=1 Tax=Streptomyces zhaozhouensis TaxID=1300267 RepID=A0A286E4C7_9ACTN|nr:TerD family protein [Streptomyces zhaozhouensis]SOD65724.1 Stress response protein SCP2 [Streptomyces zhaozhouensis]
MQEMVKGGNVGLASLSEHAGAVVVGLSWSSEKDDGDADVSVLLLDADGKVRGDDDFFFYNHVAAPDGSVQLLGKSPSADGSEDRISVDLGALPGEVARVVVAASRYGGGCFGDLDDIRLTVADRDGETLLGFGIADASRETAFVFGEFYRRSDEWRFRAVGQGYASGLAGLATDFGIDIDDDEAADEDGSTGEGESAGEDETTGETTGGEKTAEERGTGDAPASAAPTAPATDGTGQDGAALSRGEGPASAAPAGSLTTAEPPAVPTPRDRDTAPASTPAGDAPGAAAPRRRPRSTRKKVTLPKAPKKSLAENPAWRPARLFPVSSLRTDREREARATSVLLSVMAEVPEFGRRLTAGFGAPAGRMETFTEVTLPHGETPRRPDGVIRVERAGKLWTALVETKTNGNPLKSEQVQDYMDIAARRAYETVITLSNDVALEGSPLVDVKIDRRRRHRVSLWHLSWAEVAHQAQMLIRHEGVSNGAHVWLLQELLRYLQHENSGCHGFQNMGPAWVPVRRAIDDETLTPGDPRAARVIESWERLIRQVCLRLGGELGRKVLPVRRTRRGTEPAAQRAALADQFCLDGRLVAELRIEGGPGILSLTADLRTGKARTSVDVQAPEQGYPLAWAKRLLRQLAEAPADLHVQTLVEGTEPGPRGTLERLRPEPADLLPRQGAQITGFRLSLLKGLGNGRGNSETSFIRSVDDAVDRFVLGVVGPLERGPGRR